MLSEDKAAIGNLGKVILGGIVITVVLITVAVFIA